MRVDAVPTEDSLRKLLEEARESGADHVVVETSHDAGDAWIRAGFSEETRVLRAPLDLIERLLAGAQEPSFGSVHVQTDDMEAVIRGVRQFVPRLPGGSRGSVVAPPRNGWIAVYDELCDREPEMLRRLARELSDRMGAVVLHIGVEEGAVVRFALLERGRVMDEYLSVPEYHGPLPPGDVIGLGANPTVVARLTGAEPARVRDVARTAKSPEELAPAPELIERIASVIGVEGAEHGYAAALALPSAIVVTRG
ncbi:MAG TPA: hypothetical protein VN960_09120 [Gaiellaceae bacterium]|nr:hypothetical protein [Gaiellaceae bacterium]